MTIGSLFSGIGGLELGLEALGLGPVVWQAESNSYCRAVLAKHWPAARRFERVEDVNEHAPRVRVLCGGFPCQDISRMGKRAGINGTRSGLWGQYVRVVRILRPPVLVVENVPELALYLDRVLGPLADLGFDAEWGVFSAEEVGAPHLRQRMFILAWSVADTYGDGREGGRCSGAREALSPLARGGAVADADGEGRLVRPDETRLDGSGAGSAGCGAWSPEPDVGRVVDGVSSRLESRRRRARLTALGNAVVGPQAEVAVLTLARRAGLIGQPGEATQA